VEPDGTASIVGGPVYFMETTVMPRECGYRKPLSFEAVQVQRVLPGKMFHVKRWQGQSDNYALTVVAGTVQASGSTHGIY